MMVGVICCKKTPQDRRHFRSSEWEPGSLMKATNFATRFLRAIPNLAMNVSPSDNSAGSLVDG
jgi:hypothetical protein